MLLLKEERPEPAAKLGVFAASAFHARVPRDWHPFTRHGPGFGSAGAETPFLPSQLVQIIINTTHLEKSCKFLEEFITNITNVLPETVHTTKLYGTTTFKVSPGRGLGGCREGSAGGALGGSWAEPKDNSGLFWEGCAITLGLSFGASLLSRSWEVFSLIYSPN